MTRTIMLSLAVLALGACGGQPPVPEDFYYRLVKPAAPAQAQALSDGTIFVEQFIADGVHRERALTYVTGDPAVEIRQHHYHHWMDSPSRMLRDQLIDTLRAGQAAPLVTDAPEVVSDLNIHGKIRRFDQRPASGGEVTVALDFRVERSDRPEPLLVRSYEARAPVAGRDMAAAAGAYSVALAEIYAALIADIAAAR
jgi:ABC-type uncharacterized transport system auxiliary subunit